MSLEEEGAVSAKIIDPGLAKPAPDAQPAEASISTLGAFAGTPEFASPEQFAGVGVDIRSDLYSLGVVLWEMLTGHVVFRGSPAEVMHHHLHTPLPFEQVRGFPQPVVVLLAKLLEKDPARRFQSPDELNPTQIENKFPDAELDALADAGSHRNKLWLRWGCPGGPASIRSNNIGAWMPHHHRDLPFTLGLEEQIGCAEGF